jgi:glycosyltransferase involved in cell wall biosynthesis
MRVAHFVHRYPPALGGAESYFARLSCYLVAHGDSVSVFTTNALDLESFWSRSGHTLSAGTTVEDGVEVHRYPLRFRFRGRRWVCKALSLIPHHGWQRLCMGHNPIAPAMWRDADRSDISFDIVHATAFPYGFPLACAMRLSRTLRIPFILTPFLHTGDPDDPRDSTRRAYLQPALLSVAQAADRVLVQTVIERQAFLDAGLDSTKLIVQGLGVDPAECTGGDRAATRRAWGVGDDEVIVGHLANNSEEKGTCDLLRASSLAWSRGARFHVVLAGPEMPNFRRFWSSYPDANRVRRLGVLSDEQKRAFFAAIDLFCLPSRSDSFGLVLLEAWANGVPNIGYRAGGIAGVIRHEEDGLLVKCGELQALSATLTRLVDGGVLRQRLGKEGQRRALNEYRWEDKLALVREAYQSASG